MTKGFNFKWEVSILDALEVNSFQKCLFRLLLQAAASQDAEYLRSKAAFFNSYRYLNTGQ